jgi:hypothetical protein
MDIGPVEYMVVAFPGNKFTGQIVAELKELTKAGTLRIPVRLRADGNLVVERGHRTGQGDRDRRSCERGRSAPLPSWSRTVCGSFVWEASGPRS